MQVVQVENLYVILLPPNATALIQPLDQGIMAMVKARYRKWYLHWVLSQDNRANGITTATAMSDSDEERDKEVVAVPAADAPLHRLKRSVRRGIKKLANIWSEIEPTHITNCWRRADIVPQHWCNTLPLGETSLLQQELEALGDLIPRAHPDPHTRMNAMEFIHDVTGENERDPLTLNEDVSPTNFDSSNENAGSPATLSNASHNSIESNPASDTSGNQNRHQHSLKVMAMAPRLQ